MDFITALGIFIAIDVFIVLYFIFLRKKSKFSQKDLKIFQIQWNKISQEKDFQRAIMEADKLLDLALKKKGYSGNLGEKLKKTSQLFKDINGVWSAHKLRNRLAHELDFHPSKNETAKALLSFKKALQDLKAL